MKKLLLIIYISIGFMKAQSPMFQWAKSMPGAASNIGVDIVVDLSGNVYTTGSFSGITDFDPGIGTFTLTTNGSYDIFVSKIDALGNFVWAKQIGGSFDCNAFSIALDASGNVYTTGLFEGNVDFDPSVGTFTLNSFGSSIDVFVSKLDGSGNFLWAKQMGGTSFEEGKSISLDNSKNVYITGYFSSVGDYDPGAGIYNLNVTGNNDGFVTKLDSLGNFVWAKKIGGTLNDICFANFTSLSGEVYISGIFNGTADFDPGAGTFNLTSSGAEDIYIAKLDATGNFLWAKKFGGPSTDLAYSIFVESTGNIYTTGAFDGTADFDPGATTFNLTSNGSRDIFISKLDGLGNFLWAKSIGGTTVDYGQSIKTDQSGNIYTAGYFEGTVDFNPGPGINNLTSFGLKDIFLSKLDASGNFVWAKNIGGPSDDVAYSCILDASDNFYATGYFDGTVDFDPGTGIANLNCSGLGDIFILKMSQTPIGIEEKSLENNINFYPNPTSGIINLESEFLTKKNSKIQIVNSLGEVLFEENVDKYNSLFNIQHFSTGIYFLKIITEGEIISTQKIIKE